LLAYRLGFLGTAFSIQFLRYAQLGIPRLTRLRPYNVSGRGGAVAGIPGDTGDTAWQAIHFQLQDGLGRQRHFLARGFLDSAIVNGVLAPSGFASGAINAWKYKITNGQWQLGGLSRPRVLQDVASVTTNGFVTTVLAHGWTPGTRITFFRTRDAAGSLVTGTYTVIEVGSTTTARIAPWLFLTPVPVGQAHVISAVFQQINFALELDVRLHKVGRPFGQLRGRRRSPGTSRPSSLAPA
jgi:hypothetical protein